MLATYQRLTAEHRAGTIICQCEHANHFADEQMVSRGYSHAYGAPCAYVVRVDHGLLVCGECDRVGHGQQGRAT